MVGDYGGEEGVETVKEGGKGLLECILCEGRGGGTVSTGSMRETCVTQGILALSKVTNLHPQENPSC